MGSLEGVVATRAAWVGKLEVVEVAFRPAVLSYSALLDHAIASQCDQAVFATGDEQLALARGRVGERARRLEGEPRVAKDSDQLYYLLQSPLRFLPLTPAQARQVNGALGTQGDPAAYLSPRQVALLASVERAYAEDPESFDGLERPAGDEALTGLDEHSERVLELLIKVF